MSKRNKERPIKNHKWTKIKPLGSLFQFIYGSNIEEASADCSVFNDGTISATRTAGPRQRPALADNSFNYSGSQHLHCYLQSSVGFIWLENSYVLILRFQFFQHLFQDESLWFSLNDPCEVHRLLSTLGLVN